MKLYAWKPSGHGEYSFYVCAENEEEARKAVDKYIAEPKINMYKSDFAGWGTDYYELTIASPLYVIINSND